MLVLVFRPSAQHHNRQQEAEQRPANKHHLYTQKPLSEVVQVVVMTGSLPVALPAPQDACGVDDAAVQHRAGHEREYSEQHVLNSNCERLILCRHRPEDHHVGRRLGEGGDEAGDGEQRHEGEEEVGAAAAARPRRRRSRAEDARLSLIHI